MLEKHQLHVWNFIGLGDYVYSHWGGGFTRVSKPHIQLKAGGRWSCHQSKATKQSVVDDDKLSV